MKDDLPLIDTALVFDDNPLKPNDAGVQFFGGGPDSALDPFSVIVQVLPNASGQLLIQLSFLGTVLCPASARILLRQIDAILQSMVHKPNDSFTDIHSEIESALLSSYAPKHPDLPPTSASMALHAQFEYNAKENPHDLALVFLQNLDSRDNGGILEFTENTLGSFIAFVNKGRATHAHLTPAFAAAIPRDSCPTLQVVTMIGEKLTQAVADDWSRDMHAFNTYGPAEAAVVATYARFGEKNEGFKSDNIGLPLASVSIFVLRNDKLVLRQGTGELALAGPQLANGYLGDPIRTSERFKWNANVGQKVYMTGDIVRQLYNGTLEYLGREDDLLKISGIRIELSEISFALRKCHPLVEQVEVLYINRPDRISKVLVAFCAASKVQPDDGNSLILSGSQAIEIAKSAKSAASSNLPDYLVPTFYLIMRDIPRTESAKTDKRRLSSIYASVDLDGWESALDVTKTIILDDPSWNTADFEVFRLLSDHCRMSIDASHAARSLSAIGVDSIGAITLTSKLNAANYNVSVMQVLGCSTVRDLALLVNTVKSPDVMEDLKNKLNDFDETWSPIVRPKVTSGGFRVLPCIPVQESLLGESLREAQAYWSNHFFKLHPEADLDRLKHAWQRAVSRNEALRTSFLPSASFELRMSPPQNHSAFLQIIHDSVEIDWTQRQINEGDLKSVSEERSLVIGRHHQDWAFSSPPWAITIYTIKTSKVSRWLVLTLHHSIHDGQSLGYISSDVYAAYYGLDSDRALRHQIHDMIALSGCLVEGNADQTSSFWSQVLRAVADSDRESSWPDLTGQKRAKQTPTEKKLISLTRDLTCPLDKISLLSKSFEKASIASVIRLAWSHLVAEYLESQNVVIAQVFSDRISDSRLENVIGPLISVLPMAYSIGESTHILLDKQARFLSEAWDHRSVKANMIRKMLKVPQDRPLYPAMFAFNPSNDRPEDSDHSQLWIMSEDLVGLTVEHPVALNVEVTSDGDVQLAFSADPNTMNHEQLSLLARQTDALITLVVDHPRMGLSSLTDMMPTELLSRTSLVNAAYPHTRQATSPTHWVEYYAKFKPNWTAVEVATRISEDGNRTETWNYSTLNARASKVSAFIKSNNLKKKVIALCMGRTLHAYSVILGILKSGNTYLPIDEDLPLERKSFLLFDGQPSLLFTTRHYTKQFQEAGVVCQLVHVDDPSYLTKLDNLSSEEKPIEISPQDNAYLLYTSGSTGKPKGVLVGRENLCCFINGLSELITNEVPDHQALQGSGKYLGLASRAFDVHIAEMFLAWRHGLTAVTAPRSMLLDDLALAMKSLKVTHASFVPSLIEQARLNPSLLPDVRYLGVGGEKMSLSVAETWTKDPRIALINAYGPTELAIGCSAARMTPQSSLRNIGKPFKGNVFHVLVPGTTSYTKRGVQGELCVTGKLVANGYLNRPDAKGFIEDFNGDRMYRTGDMVRLMADDSVEYLGRNDDQTKIRGQRLELGEVSEGVRSSSSEPVDVATISVQHPDLSRPQLVSFVARQSRSGSRQHVATAFVGSDFDVWSPKIQEGCKKILPQYMVPDLIIPIAFLPLTSTSAKADTKQLKQLFATIPLSRLLRTGKAESAKQSRVVRPLTPHEEKIRDAVVGTVSVDQSGVGPSSNIFQLGVDSLSAISLSMNLRKVGLVCSVADVLTNPTIEQLAAVSRAQDGQSNSDHLLKKAREVLASTERRVRKHLMRELPSLQIASILPCLPLQEGILARSMSITTADLYVNHIVLKLSHRVDTERFKLAWFDIARSRGILRTCFWNEGTAIFQVILESINFELPWEDRGLIDVLAELRAFGTREKRISRDILDNIRTTPPLRMSLARSKAASEDSLFFLSIHHALYDAESFSLLLEELYTRYQSLPAPSRTSIESLVEHIAMYDEVEVEAYWKKQLQGQPGTLLNEFSLTGPKTSTTMDRVLNIPLSDIKRRSASLKVPPSALLQATFGITLARHLQRRSITFGCILSGRSVPVKRPETILSPCITTIPQCIRLEADGSTVAEVIARAQSDLSQSLRFQHTSLRDIHRWLKADRLLFDTLFSYVVESVTPSYSSLWSKLESFMPADYPFAIEFEAKPSSDSVVAHAAFTPSFGDSGNVQAFVESMELLLREIVRGESVTIADLGIRANADSVDLKVLPNWSEEKWTATEDRVRDIVSDVCGLSASDFSKATSFFRLGIDSVVAIEFASRLRQAGLAVFSSDIMAHPCIGALCHQIGRREKSSGSNEANVDSEQEEFDASAFAELQKRHPSIVKAYNCTPLQAGMLTQTLSSGGDLYFHHHVFCLVKDINMRKLHDSWKRTVERNDILRTSFHLVNLGRAKWMAAVHQLVDSRWSESAISTDFDINRFRAGTSPSYEQDFESPPFQMIALDSPSARYLILSIHHSLYDGISLPYIFDDLADYYNGSEVASRIQFHQAAAFISQNQGKAVQFHVDRLDGYESLGFAAKHHQTSTRAYRIRRGFGLDLELVMEKCKAIDVTLQSVCLLAYGKLLSTMLHRRDVVFGHVLSGRSLPIKGVESIAGPLFNTVPFRVRLGRPLFSNAIAASQIQKVTADMQAFQQVSLSAIQAEWRRSKGDTGKSLFDALFVFQRDIMTDRSGADPPWVKVDLVNVTDRPEYPLSLEVEQSISSISILAACHSEYWTEQELEMMVIDFLAICHDILQRPARSVTAFPESLQSTPLESKSGGSSSVVDDTEHYGAENEIIAHALADVAKVSREAVTMDTSIYSLGLDSIAAIRVAALCRQNKLRMSVADVLQGGSLRGICSQLAKSLSALPNAEETELVPLDACRDALAKISVAETDVEAVLPALPGQVYHLAMGLKGGHSHVEPTWGYLSSQKLDIPRLKRAWSRLREKHSILRTTFVSSLPAKVLQIVFKFSAIKDDRFEIVKADADVSVVIREQIHRKARSSSDLLTPPLCCCVIKTPVADAVLLTLHHALYDAWTIPFLISDLCRLYTDDLNSTTYSFPNFSSFTQFAIHTLGSIDQEAYWKTALLGYQPTIIQPRHTTASGAALEDTFVYLVGLLQNTSPLDRALRQHGLSLHTVVLLGISRVLSKVTSTASPTFAIYHAGRSASYEGIERLSGPCLNVTPMTVPNARERLPVEAARDIRDGLAKRTGCIEQSALSDVVGWCSTTGSKNAIFNTWVNLLWHDEQTEVKGGFLEPMDGLELNSINEAEPPKDKEKTMVDDLETVDWIAENNLFIDVKPNVADDALDFGLRCDGMLMNEEELKALATALSQEISLLVEEISSS
ncbi:MAG: NRPS [Sarcosagium campestre]|nr:MAG: NRPS [Sarcosagium campestre]